MEMFALTARNLERCSKAVACFIAEGLRQWAFDGKSTGHSTYQPLRAFQELHALSSTAYGAVFTLTKVLSMHLWSTEELRGLVIKR